MIVLARSMGCYTIGPLAGRLIKVGEDSAVGSIRLTDVARQSYDARLPAAALAALLSAGCAGGRAASGGLDAALSRYEAGQYQQARRLAEEVRRQESRPDVRAKAAYLDGLCAYRLGDDAAAGDDLRIAAESGVAPTAGKARAVLGLVLLRADRPGEAAAQLAQASRALIGPDARQAAAHAALAYERAGDRSAARAWRRIAEADEQTMADAAGPGAGGFTLQAGAFRQRDHAARAARDATPIAQHHGLDPVNIVPMRDDHGEVMYLVQFGRFNSRTAATEARTKLGSLQIIVVSAKYAF